MQLSLMFDWIECKHTGVGIEINNDFMIMFCIITNKINSLFYFYIWYNKILMNEMGKKKFNYNNIYNKK